MEKLRLLHGPDVAEELNGADVTVYAYAVNKFAMYTFLGVAGVLYLFSAYVWFGGLVATAIWWKIAIIVALLVATAASLTVTYWNNYQTRHFVAIDDQGLMVGDRERMWRISWDLLSVEKLGLKEMELSKATGQLDIHVAGQNIKLLLYSPFVLLADPQGFMFDLLSRFSDLSAEELAEAVEIDESAVEENEEVPTGV